MVSSTAVFTKAKHSHLRLLSSSFQYHHKLKEAPRPHLLTHYFTDPSSANPRRHVTVMQCFTCQPNRSPRPLSQHFSQKSEGIFYIWAVYISDLLVIVRYFASFTSNQGLVMRSLLLCFFFFPFFFSLFDVWVFASDLTISNRGDGFSTRGKFASLFFFLYLMFGFSHLI